MVGSLETWNLPRLTLVVGGARSGKSRLAERLAAGTGLRRHYIATAAAWDDEMRARIGEHQVGRGADWVTHEAPREVGRVLSALTAQDVVLLDCATLWLTNVMLAGASVAAESHLLLAALARCPAPVVVVSNEVGWGIVPENALARAFRDHQGRLNQQLATQSGLVLGVMAGLPMILKGALPPGFHHGL